MMLVFERQSNAQSLFQVHEAWVDMTLWYNINESVKIGGDFGYRTALSQTAFQTFYFRPSLRWQLNKVVILGFAISNHQTFNTEVSNLNELRFAQQLFVKSPNIWKFKINHRLRFEERYFFINQAKEDAMRMRYRLAINPPSFSVFNIASPFYSRISWEAFITLGTSYEDLIGNSHRWEIMLGNKITKSLKISMVYFWQSTRTVDQLFLLEEDIYRLRIGYTF